MRNHQHTQRKLYIWNTTIPTHPTTKTPENKQYITIGTSKEELKYLWIRTTPKMDYTQEYTQLRLQ